MKYKTSYFVVNFMPQANGCAILAANCYKARRIDRVVFVRQCVGSAIYVHRWQIESYLNESEWIENFKCILRSKSCKLNTLTVVYPATDIENELADPLCIEMRCLRTKIPQNLSTLTQWLRCSHVPWSYS